MLRNLTLTICLLFVLSSLQAQFKTHQFFNQNGDKLSFEEVLVLSEEASVVFFGELHNNSLAHWFQLQLLKGLQAKHPDLVLAAEFFERDDQLNIEEWFAGKITEKNFEAEAKLWNNYQTDYRPLMRFAQEKGLDFVASNVPRKYASLVSRDGLDGLDSLSEEAKKYLAQLPIHFDSNLPGYVAMKGMMHGAPGNADFMLQAQALKDATMAESLFPYIDKGHKILHVNGSYHSKDGEGILWFLLKKYPELKILNIHTVEQDQLESLEESHAKSGQVILVLPSDSHKSY
ncbi:ChaN family lipoprotein [Algoriphagus sp. CAU 1675]|uniref:ChaN family lipoprotein n=1 Tax=Algoriphagus sp. CAU 1675 TaxID=3032597 RepID=UPI0023DC7725|nr:ChaN family lipoprotein [Algoriphagus sp. CAU 1675]MDF2158390.1 ChaN family lipoprotein [Algoriphagus sp. CAU 1675]